MTTPMASQPNLRLTLSSSPENVLVVRQALSGVAEALRLSSVQSNDLYTAVTEACNNVVMFAYAGGEGPLEVAVLAEPDVLTASVADRGGGIGVAAAAPAIGQPRGEPGIGLALIRAVADSVEMLPEPGGGTKVVMSFHTPLARRLDAVADPPTEGGDPSVGELIDALPADTVRIELTPPALVPVVLPRTLTALAAGARFTIDQLANIDRLGRALASCARDSASVALSVSVAIRVMRLQLSPCRAAPGASANIAAALESGLRVEPLEPPEMPLPIPPPGGEGLALRVSQPPG
jgi:serine/threonine-protein kinase RsbW